MKQLRDMDRKELAAIIDLQPENVQEKVLELLYDALAWTCGTCGKPRAEERYDRYGIYAGKKCDSCWKSSGIAEWMFDAGYAGESLEAEDY